MNIILTFFWLILGLGLLVKGSDVFVDASSGIARNFNVPNLIIGLTIMAFGTSAPEAFIGVRAALDGTSALAMGNVIGSDIFNLIFIIGFAATVTPMNINFKIIARDYWVALSGPIILLMMMLFFDDTIPRVGGAFFLLLFSGYVWVIIRKTLKFRKENPHIEEELIEPIKPLKRNILFALLGLGFIILGGELAVHNAVYIAELLGMSTRVVGLTIVAIGTSLPELIIVFMASRRKESELAIGNIIGSCIFNIMFVLGLSGVIAPLPIESGLIFDLVFLLSGSLIFLFFVHTKKRITRFEGLTMMAMYLAYLSYIIWW